MTLKMSAEDLRSVVAACADKKDPREFLKAVCFDFNDMQAVGCNGHICVSAPFTCQDKEEAAMVKAAVAGETTQLFLKIGTIPADSYAEDVLIDVMDRRLRVLGRTPKEALIERYVEEGRVFEWQRVHVGWWKEFRPAVEGFRCVAFNPQLLHKVIGSVPIRMMFQTWAGRGQMGEEECPNTSMKVEVYGRPNLKITLNPCRW